MEAATKLNYRPNAYAQAVAKGTAPNIVLLVSDISDPHFASVSHKAWSRRRSNAAFQHHRRGSHPARRVEAVRKSQIHQAARHHHLR